MVLVIRGNVSQLGQIDYVPDGTESLPSIAFQHDTDTGVSRKGENQLRLSAGGTERMVVSDTGVTMTTDATIHSHTVGRGGGGILTNVALGTEALASNTTGSANTATGQAALLSNTTGSSNTAMGQAALFSNTTGSFNTAVGQEALFSNTTGLRNTATGMYALRDNTTGLQNTATGHNALRSNTTGSSNTAMGRLALFFNTTGSSNTAVGMNALRYTTTGGDNFNYSNCAGLGYDTRTSGDNQVQLGDSATTTYAFGAVQDRSDARDKADIQPEPLGLQFINALTPVTFRWDYRDDYLVEKYVPRVSGEPDIPDGTYPVMHQTTTIATADVTESKVTLRDAHTYDTDDAVPTTATIHETTVNIEPETTLVPIPKDGSKKRAREHHGLIAQDLVRVIEDLGIDDFAGLQHHQKNGGEDVYSIGYTELIAPLIKAVQELTAKNDQQQTEIDALHSEIDALKAA
jgi:hypothetical protein